MKYFLTGNSRSKRSPFKKHKIVYVDGGWTAPQQPAPRPQPQPAEHTIVEHHHHHHYSLQPPPSTTIHIEGHKHKEDEKFKELQHAVDDAYLGFEKDKKETINTFKASAEATLEALARLPFQIATDIDFIGSKVKDDFDSKHDKDKGIAIQVWKHKGNHGGGGWRGGAGGGGGGSGWSSGHGGSEETVQHHHHYYGGGGSATGGGTQYGQTENTHYYPPPPPPRPQQGSGSGSYEYSGHNYRAPQHGQQQQYEFGSKGKGIQFRIWKDSR